MPSRQQKLDNEMRKVQLNANLLKQTFLQYLLRARADFDGIRNFDDSFGRVWVNFNAPTIRVGIILTARDLGYCKNKEFIKFGKKMLVVNV